MKEVDFEVDEIKYVGWDSFTPEEATVICNHYGLPDGIVKSTSGYGPYAGLAKVHGFWLKTPGIQDNQPTVTNNSKYSGDIVIPPTVVHKDKNYLVVEIGKRAFYNASEVRSVTLPDSIRRIEMAAFLGSKHLGRINLPENLSYIGNGAFSCCNLVRVVLPDNLSELQRGTVLFPGETTGTDSWGNIFWSCKNLEDLTIGSGMRKMDRAFEGCIALRTIVCKASTPPIITEGTFGDKVFENATLYVPFLSYELYKKDSMWGKFSKIEPIPETIPQNEIFYFAIDEFKRFMTKQPNSNEVYFAPVDKTKYINYNAGVIEIPSQVEYANKTYIVTGIADKAFEKSTTTTVKLPNTIKSIGFSAFYSARIENINIPNSLEIIEEEAFDECEKLKEIEIPSSVTIGPRAFSDCTSLKRVTLHDGIETICEEAFCNCESLTEIEIPGSVTDIGERVFQGCHSLKRINLHEGIKRIREDAFEGAVELQELTIPNTVVQIDGGAFHACGRNSPTRLDLTIPDSVTTIEPQAFRACRIGSLRLGKGLTKIDIRVFQKSELKELVIPAGITSIGEKAFAENDNNFQTITCEGITPPAIEEDTFDELTYKNAMLRVPADGEDAYNDDPMWGKFRQIESF